MVRMVMVKLDMHDDYGDGDGEDDDVEVINDSCHPYLQGVEENDDEDDNYHSYL